MKDEFLGVFLFSVDKFMYFCETNEFPLEWPLKIIINHTNTNRSEKNMTKLPPKKMYRHIK